VIYLRILGGSLYLDTGDNRYYSCMSLYPQHFLCLLVAWTYNEKCCKWLVSAVYTHERSLGFIFYTVFTHGKKRHGSWRKKWSGDRWYYYFFNYNGNSIFWLFTSMRSNVFLSYDCNNRSDSCNTFVRVEFIVVCMRRVRCE